MTDDTAVLLAGLQILPAIDDLSGGDVDQFGIVIEAYHKIRADGEEGSCLFFQRYDRAIASLLQIIDRNCAALIPHSCLSFDGMVFVLPTGHYQDALLQKSRAADFHAIGREVASTI